MSVSAQIEIPLASIEAFCVRWQIVEFALFGSVIREDFNEQSDIDVLAAFEADVRYSLFDLVTMTDELEAILGRAVDLIDRQALLESRNYLRRQMIFESARVIYAK